MSKLVRTIARHFSNGPHLGALNAVNGHNVPGYENIRQKDVFFRKYNKALRNRVAPDLEKKPFEDVYLERNEIETRILKRLYHSELVDIHKFNFKMDLRKDLGLDSLNITALITEIEQEFTVVFEDKVFETVTNLNDLIYKISRDPKAF